MSKKGEESAGSCRAKSRAAPLIFTRDDGSASAASVSFRLKVAVCDLDQPGRERPGPLCCDWVIPALEVRHDASDRCFPVVVHGVSPARSVSGFAGWPAARGSKPVSLVVLSTRAFASRPPVPLLRRATDAQQEHCQGCRSREVLPVQNWSLVAFD